MVLASESRHKMTDAPYPSGFVVDVEKVKSIVFLLIGVRKGICPVKLCTKSLVRTVKRVPS